MTLDELFMRRCIQLARNGFQNARPNPMVGAVVVYDGRIIGEGYHVRCGQGHAEVNALASVRSEDFPLLKESTIYVSLEPCAHYGKTPPCARLIVEKGLKRCVVGCVDPFSKVQGRGIAILREAGIEVTVGVLEEECRALNKHFMTFHSLHRPFITLKWAQTADGFIGRTDQTPDKLLIISNSLTSIICHKRRAEHQSILVGRNTVITDRPSLNVRFWSGPSPLRVVLAHEHVEDYDANYADSIEQALGMLYEKGIQSLLVEGGAQTLQNFIDRELWDEAYVETGATPLISECHDTTTGVKAPKLKNALRISTQTFGYNTISVFKHR